MEFILLKRKNYLAIQTQLVQQRDTIKEQEERNAAVELEMVKLNVRGHRAAVGGYNEGVGRDGQETGGDKCNESVCEDDSATAHDAGSRRT